MVEISDLIKNIADQKPSEFGDNFDSLLKDRIAQLVADKKVELSSTLFGAPEAVDNEIDTEEQPDQEDDDATAKGQEATTGSDD